MAIIAPAFVLLIFAIIEVAQWMHAKNVALGAAREGVAKLRQVPTSETCPNLSIVEAAAVQTAAGFGSIQNATAQATCDVDNKNRVTVRVDGTVVDLIPGWDLSVTASASGLVEVFQPDTGSS